MPLSLKQGYTLIKVIIYQCMIIDHIKASQYISSYLPKIKAFEEFVDQNGSDAEEQIKAARFKEAREDVPQKASEVIKQAQKILARLEDSFAKGDQQSFFVPNYNLIGHPQYVVDYKPLLYVKICRAVLSDPSHDNTAWSSLAEYVIELLYQDEHLCPDTIEDEFSQLTHIAGITDFSKASRPWKDLIMKVQRKYSRLMKYKV